MGANKRDNIDIRFGEGLGDQGLARLGRRPERCGLRMREGKRTYISVYAAAGLTYGQPYELTYSQTPGQEVKTVTPGTANFPVEIAVPYQIESQYLICWLQIGGPAEALVDGTDNVAAGNFLEVIASGTAFIKAGTSLCNSSKAVAYDARTADSAALSSVVLIDKLCEIDAA